MERVPVHPLMFSDPYSPTSTNPNYSVPIKKPVYNLLQSKLQHYISHIQLEYYPSSLVFPSVIASKPKIPKLQQNIVPFPAMNMTV